jgi:hypothetical protein
MANITIEKCSEQEENYVVVLVDDNDTITIRDLDSGVSMIKSAKQYSSGSRIQFSNDFVIIKK